MLGIVLEYEKKGVLEAALFQLRADGESKIEK
jgi:hypothetical protein